MESQTEINTMADWTLDEQDYLLQCLFDCQKSAAASSVNMLYYAVTNMRDQASRQNYLLKFFESIRGNNRPANMRNSILSSCSFS